MWFVLGNRVAYRWEKVKSEMKLTLLEENNHEKGGIIRVVDDEVVFWAIPCTRREAEQWVIRRVLSRGRFRGMKRI